MLRAVLAVTGALGCGKAAGGAGGLGGRVTTGAGAACRGMTAGAGAAGVGVAEGVGEIMGAASITATGAAWATLGELGGEAARAAATTARATSDIRRGARFTARLSSYAVNVVKASVR